MILKLVFDSKLKKVSLENRAASLVETLEIAGRLAKVKADQVELFYKDSEGDVIKIVDSDDFEYFLSHAKVENGLYPTIEVKIATQTSESNSLALDSLKEMEKKVKSLSESFIEVKNSLVASKEVETQVEAQPEVVPEVAPEVVPEVISENELEIQIEQEAPKEEAIVEETSPEPKNEQIPAHNVHINVVCDGCRAQPIIGRRFKCMICFNFDLCETCEAKEEHEHPMLRLSKLSSNFFLDKVQKSFASLEESRIQWLKEKMSHRRMRRLNQKAPAEEAPKEEQREKRRRDQCKEDRKMARAERREMRSELKEVQPCHKRNFFCSEKKNPGCPKRSEEGHRKRGRGFQNPPPEINEILQIVKLLKLEAIPRFERLACRNNW